MIRLSIVGLNHRSAPVEVRERFALSEARQSELVRRLGQIVEEVVVLSTCNRTEVLYTATDQPGHDAVVAEFRQLGQMDDAQLRTVLYCYDGPEALLHLFRVAASLDSLVPGETQITGQVKHAFDLALQGGTVRGNFNRIFQRMLATVKLVRNETGLGHGAVSVSSVAVQLAESIFEQLDTKRVLLIGAGEMSALAGEHFRAAGIASLTIANRTEERARLLAVKLYGEAATLDAVPQLLATHDIVYCCTGSDDVLLTAEQVRHAMTQRRGLPLFLIDTSVPRNIDPAVAKVDEVYLYNIDDLQTLVERNLAERRREADKAELLVRQTVQEFASQDTESIGPLIRSLQARVQTIKTEQLERLYRSHDEWDDRQRQEIDRSVDLIVNKLLHDPLISLRKGVHDDQRQSRNLVGLFKYLFNL